MVWCSPLRIPDGRQGLPPWYRSCNRALRPRACCISLMVCMHACTPLRVHVPGCYTCILVYLLGNSGLLHADCERRVNELLTCARHDLARVRTHRWHGR